MNKRPRLSIAMMIESVGLGGAEMVVLHLAREMRERGHLVHPVLPASQDGWLNAELAAAGFVWHTYSGRGMFDIGLARRLAATLRSLKVDVIHSHEFVMAYYGTFVANRVLRPHIATLHADEHMTALWHKRLALRWAFRNGTKAIAVSRHTARHLEERLSQRVGAVQVIANGIPDVQGIANPVRAELGIGPEERVILSVGSLVPRKGHAILIDALSRLQSVREIAPWRLIIAGDGPERQALSEQARAAGLANRVHLLGRRGDGANLRAAAHIFCMPSLWEGMPLAVLEAMFAGNAIVASNASGIPEVLTDEEEGLLVKPGNVAELSQGLRRLLDDAALCKRLGYNAQVRARGEFTIGAMSDAYERLYAGSTVE